MKRLICLFAGHRPNFVLRSSSTLVFDGYLTCCERCHRVYEAKVER